MEDESEALSRAGRLDALHEFAGRVAAKPSGDPRALDRAAAEVLEAFEQAGVDALLLKGRALALMLYHAGEQRGYSDIDLLVAPSRLQAAEGALRGLGFSNASTVRGIDDVGGVVHAETWIRVVPGSNDQTMIDLHRWLAGARAAPATSWEVLSRRRVWIEVGGRGAEVLDRPGQAMHLALHAAQHGPAFDRHLHELALALQRWPADVWEAAARVAEEIDATEAFAAGLRLLDGGEVITSALGLPSTTRLDWTLRHREQRPRGTFHLQAFTGASGNRERLGILRRSLLPGRTWIIDQHPWAAPGGLRLAAAYCLHVARAPRWAARAWWFQLRARREAGRR